MVVFVPLIVLLIPALRIIPAAFKWRMQMRINRWYRELLALERSLPGEGTPANRDASLSGACTVLKLIYAPSPAGVLLS